MTYIDYLNRFNQFLESNALPPAAQLMYFKLLNVFNRAGWPPTVQVDNHRLMAMLGVHSEHTVILNRSKLIHAGFIQFHSGSKGIPSKYRLCQVSLYHAATGDRENARESDGENDSKNAGKKCSTNCSHIKTKTKNKTKTTPPKPPQGASWNSPSYDIDELAAISSFDVPDEL